MYNKELRCPECNKLFLKYNTIEGAKMQIVCSRCKTKYTTQGISITKADEILNSIKEYHDK